MLGSEEDESLDEVDLDRTWEDIEDSGSDSENPGLKTIVDEIRTAHSEPRDYTAVCFQPPLADANHPHSIRAEKVGLVDGE